MYEQKDFKQLEKKVSNLEPKIWIVFFTLDRPYLGASLDDIIGDDAIVEVTCPYAGRDLPISPGSKFKFLEFDNGENICLKKSSVNYY